MRSKIIAAIGICSALVLGIHAPAHAQGQNPPGINPEHFQCYRATGPMKAIAVKLKDQFGSGGVKVVQPVYLCNPVQKNDQEIKDPKTHLVCYQDTGLKPANKVVKVQNQFGTQTLKVTVPFLLCVPSLKEVLK